MEQYYKTLGLRLGATIEEIQEAYDRLLVELDPVNNNNLNIFKIEHDKVIEAYAILIDKLNSPDALDHHKQILERLKQESDITEDKNNFDDNGIVNKINVDKSVSKDIEEINFEEINYNKVNDNIKKESIMKLKNISIKELAFGSILLFIGIGIWGIFLQNLGYFKTTEVASTNDVQNVRVVNTVNSNIEGGQVGVSGNVDVNNTVSVSIDEVLGKDEKKYYFNNK